MKSSSPAFLRAIVLASAIGGYALFSSPAAPAPVLPKAIVAQDTILLIVSTPPTGKKKYPTGNLEGKVIDGFYKNYFGVSGRIGDSLYVDFDARMDQLWLAKSRRSHRNPIVKRFWNTIGRKAYLDDTAQMSIDEYLAVIDTVRSHVISSIDWSQVGQLLELDSTRVHALQGYASRITAAHLLSYQMTELFPSNDKKDPAMPNNRDVLDFILRARGRSFIEFIPALGDTCLSFGAGQMTSYALSADSSTAVKASLINLALPRSYQLPSHVYQLRGDDHTKAMLLLSIYNIGLLLKESTAAELTTLEGVWKDEKNIAKYISTAHHHELRAIAGMKNWLKRRGKNQYERYCSKSLAAYARSTLKNLESLQPVTQVLLARESSYHHNTRGYQNHNDRNIGVTN